LGESGIEEKKGIAGFNKKVGTINCSRSLKVLFVIKPFINVYNMDLRGTEINTG
jgi:hypothetical protein